MPSLKGYNRLQQMSFHRVHKWQSFPPMKNPWILPAVTLVLGAVGGFISGKGNAPSENENAAENSNRKTRASTREESAGEKSKRASRPGSTEAIARMPGNTNRIQALMDFYAGLTPSQMEEEARKLENLPMNERIMASFLLFGRWVVRSHGSHGVF